MEVGNSVLPLKAIENDLKLFKKSYIIHFIAIILFLISFMYSTKTIERIPCDTSVYDIFKSNFVHIELLHLLSNLYVLYSLMHFENEIGSVDFLKIMFILLILNTILEYIYRKINSNSKCSIGFSGVLIGMSVYRIIRNKRLSIDNIGSIFVLAVAPSLTKKNISLSGHLLGAISGIIVSFI